MNYSGPMPTIKIRSHHAVKGLIGNIELAVGEPDKYQSIRFIIGQERIFHV